MSDTVIRVENLSKLYRLGEVGTGTLSHDLNRWLARIRGKEDPFAKVGHINDRTQKAEKGEYVWALKDIDFEVKQGEVLGIIGKNGAGKSTLLKILSRVTSPTQGEIKVRGSITIKGYLQDRFQMDHYRGMFRVVTQENPGWNMWREDIFPASTLYVVDARDPDNMEVVSDLLIDDEGNLMATRFAGERAYTIHLPESIDPLDVIDLSDPADPKLLRLGLFVALGVGIHNLPEGMATFAGALADPNLGLAIAVAIALHNIPEGLAVAAPIYAATGSRGRAFLWSFLSGVAEPVGAGLAALVLLPFLQGPVLAGVVALNSMYPSPLGAVLSSS